MSYGCDEFGWMRRARVASVLGRGISYLGTLARLACRYEAVVGGLGGEHGMA